MDSEVREDEWLIYSPEGRMVMTLKTDNEEGPIEMDGGHQFVIQDSGYAFIPITWAIVKKWYLD